MNQPVSSSDSSKTYGLAIKSLKLVGYISGLIYFLFLTLKLEQLPLQKLYWTYSSLPVLLLLGSLTWAVNKSVHNPRRQMKNLGRIMIMTLVYSVDALVFIFNLLACMQADGFIAIKFIVMFVPLLVLSAMVYYFISFIIPGFLDTENQFYKEASLMIAYYAAGLLTVVFLALRLDGYITWAYTYVFIPMFSAFALHGLFLILQVCNKTAKADFNETLILLLIATFTILTTINLDKQIQGQKGLSWVVVLLPIDLIFAAGAVKSLVSLARKRKLT